MFAAMRPVDDPVLEPAHGAVQRDAQHDVCLGKSRIKFQCLSGGIDYLWPHFAWRSAHEN